LQELLALEEQIGDVNTGLSKSHIVDKFRTSLYLPRMSSVPDQSSKSSLESDACIICQVLLDLYLVTFDLLIIVKDIGLGLGLYNKDIG
jgi:hypothetical protein